MKQISPTTKKKIDKIIVGLIPGLIVPIIAVLIFYFVQNSTESFFEFLKSLSLSGVITHSVSIAVLPNLLIFFIFIWTNSYKAAKGVIMATIFYAILILILRFVV